MGNPGDIPYLPPIEFEPKRISVAMLPIVKIFEPSYYLTALTENYMKLYIRKLLGFLEPNDQKEGT